MPGQFRGQHGRASTPVLLMAVGLVIVLVAIGVTVFGPKEKKVDTATLANRCAFPACRAAFDPGGGRGYEGGSVAVDPHDENHMIVTDANMSAGQCLWHTTFDRGKEWTDGIFSVPGFTGCHINSGSGGHVPTGPGGVSIGPSGTVYAAYGSSNTSDLAGNGRPREAVVLGTSIDGGRKFQAKVALTPPGDDLSYARPQMSVVAGPAGKDRILLSFWVCRQLGRFCDGASFARSDDGGATFTAPVRVQSGEFGQSPSEPLQAPDGTIYMTYVLRFADGPSDLILARSTDGGATFEYEQMDSQREIGDRYDPAKLAFDPKTNTLYTVYTDNRTQTQQLVFRKSTDRGKTWSPPIGIKPDPSPATNGFSRSPTISVAPNGRIDVAYYVTPQANTDSVFWAYSIDGGARFANRQVNDRPIQRFAYNNAIGTWYPPDVTSLDDAAVIVWSDTQNTRDQNVNAQDTYLRRMLPPGGDIPP